ncbi:hypothetical protein ALC62_08886, partial [Cyphomyrmex costatus]
FISWYNIMSTKNIKIKENSRICELHFKSEDIIKEDAFVQTDGTVIYVTRKNPKLREGAVPSIFPVKKIPYFRQIEHNDRHSDDVIPHEKFAIKCETSETVLNLANEPIAPTSLMLNETLQIENGSFTPLKENVQKFSDEDINIAKNIKVPTHY